MEKAVQNSPETEAIRQRMEEVRSDLDEGVQEIVEGARDMGEWRSYVRTYPWIFLGGALAAGFLIVPRQAFGGPPNVRTLAELANAPANSSLHGNTRDTLLKFVGNLAMRGVLSYVGQQAGKFFAPPTAGPQQDDQR